MVRRDCLIAIAIKNCWPQKHTNNGYPLKHGNNSSPHRRLEKLPEMDYSSGLAEQSQPLPAAIQRVSRRRATASPLDGSQPR